MKVKINAAKIRKWREERCWSQERVAEIAGMSLRTLQRIEKNGVTSQESALALAAAFDVDLAVITLDIDSEIEKNKEKEETKKLLALKMSVVIHAISFGMVMAMLYLIFKFPNAPQRAEELMDAWWIIFLAWGVGVIGHAGTFVLVNYIQNAEAKMKSLE